MSKITNIKEKPINEKKKNDKATFMEWLNRNQNRVLSMSSQQIIIESTSSLPKSTIYRIIRKYKQQLENEGFKRLCPELIDSNNEELQHNQVSR